MDEQTLREMMDAYGNIRHQIELTEANYKTTRDKIIAKYPELQKELDDMEEELAPQIKKMMEQEKLFKRMLEDAVEQFAKTAPIKDTMKIKGKLVTVSITKGKVEWDATAMDAYALEHREILSFREEKPATSRITLNKA